MTNPPDLFATPPAGMIDELVRGNPLAWIVSYSADRLLTAAIPLRAREPVPGTPLRLLGHMSRGNPLANALQAQPVGLILFLGVNGYISPSHLSDRTQAPSWNYASAQFTARFRFFSPEETSRELSDVSAHFEAGRPGAWAVEEMGQRFNRLARAVVGFEAEVLEQSIRFKLGQDERADVFDEQLIGLDQENRPLAASMRTANSGRV